MSRGRLDFFFDRNIPVLKDKESTNTVHVQVHTRRIQKTAVTIFYTEAPKKHRNYNKVPGHSADRIHLTPLPPAITGGPPPRILGRKEPNRHEDLEVEVVDTRLGRDEAVGTTSAGDTPRAPYRQQTPPQDMRTRSTLQTSTQPETTSLSLNQKARRRTFQPSRCAAGKLLNRVSTKEDPHLTRPSPFPEQKKARWIGTRSTLFHIGNATSTKQPSPGNKA